MGETFKGVQWADSAKYQTSRRSFHTEAFFEILDFYAEIERNLHVFAAILVFKM